MKYKLSILLAVVVLVSCKTTHTISKTTKKENPMLQLIEQIQKTQPQFKTANVSKLSLELQMNERTFNVSATCKIKRDSALFISIQPFLGVEVFKIELMPDSMRVFDKMNRHYYVADYATFSKRFGVDVDFYSIQSLITAQFFCIGKKEIQADSCKLVAIDNLGKTLNFENGNIMQSTQLSLQNVITSVQLTVKNKNYELNTTYKNYTNTNGVSFPQNILVSANGNNSKISCNFSILKADFNTDIKMQGTSPDRFARANIDDLLKK